MALSHFSSMLFGYREHLEFQLRNSLVTRSDGEFHSRTRTFQLQPTPTPNNFANDEPSEIGYTDFLLRLLERPETRNRQSSRARSCPMANPRATAST